MALKLTRPPTSGSYTSAGGRSTIPSRWTFGFSTLGQRRQLVNGVTQDHGAELRDRVQPEFRHHGEFRIDFPVRRAGLGRRHRRVLDALAAGGRTAEVAALM